MAFGIVTELNRIAHEHSTTIRVALDRFSVVFICLTALHFLYLRRIDAIILVFHSAFITALYFAWKRVYWRTRRIVPYSLLIFALIIFLLAYALTSEDRILLKPVDYILGIGNFVDSTLAVFGLKAN